ncbi:type III PLP-dependent enzyme [Candidatus Saccharibacteria bacterium]|nr:type III PLP-dependent enzyme [Candidatus Saccharibacteria bacterium]
MIPNNENILDAVRLVNYPTPFFFTSRPVLKHNYKMFSQLFDGSEVYYAVKANSDSGILEYLAELGCGFEAASSYEIDQLLKLGVNPDKIIYGTSVKPIDHIKYAFSNGINRFAADSKEEIEKIAVSAPGSKVFIRATVDDTGSVFTFSERFGAPTETVKDLVLKVKNSGLKTYGISFHVGSQATNENRWANAISMIRPVIEDLASEGVTLEMIDIGGGFPVVYYNHQNVPHLPEIVSHVRNSLHMLPYIPKIVMEPGRGIVASSTVLVASVISRTVRGGKVWLCLDAGIYNALYEAMIHQGLTQYNVHPFSDQEDSDRMHATLAGPTGDSLDIIARDIEIPSYIDVGDKLIFENAGAYTVTMSCAFNGFPKPELYIS